MAVKNEKSALERIRELDAEKTRIMAEAKVEALEAAENAVKALNELGFDYRLTEGTSRAVRKAVAEAPSPKASRQVNPDRACPICGFKTTPPHDARAHRAQSDKKPFTDQELKARGLARM